jgi:hypothetical protein
VPDPDSPFGVRIEYDPTRPAGRLRFSVAHEIGHTLFPDVAEAPRHRTAQGAVAAPTTDEWQLELLCNVAAAELLMPAQTLADLNVTGLDLRDVMKRRKELQVSSEALLRRLVSLTEQPATMFAARPSPDGYLVDYSELSRAGGPKISRGDAAPVGSVLNRCTAVGFTASAIETWVASVGPMAVQAVGIPPYPGHHLPRVAGVLQPASAGAVAHGATLVEVTGTAVEPDDPSTAMVVHVVNDRARTWGGTFGSGLGRRYPWASEAFRAWTFASEDNLRLGSMHVVEGPLGDPVICSLVAQEGFGASEESRLRYRALADSIDLAAQAAQARGRAVHCPRLGTGEGRGHWDLVRDQLDRGFVRRGVDVTVYRLPNS